MTTTIAIEDAELLRADEIAERLRVGPATVAVWYRKKLIRGHRIGPRLVRFILSEVYEDLSQPQS